MSYQPITPADPRDPSKNLDAESYELLSLDRKQHGSLAPKRDSKTHSRLSSTWKTYWQTLSTMLVLFLLAWIIATIHLAVFVFLNGKRADGPQSISQSYVAALSHLLGLLFRATLCGSLAVAFTQYLWRLMRIKTVKVSSIELLFKITSNPFLLTLPDVVKTAPTLFILALFTWLLPIAVTFPPGALIVVSTPVRSSYNAIVPTYNGSFIGNGSMADSNMKSIAIRHMGGGEWDYLGVPTTIRRTGRLVLELDDIVPSSSPCGPDCTYATQFEGPYLRCTNTIYNYTETGEDPNEDCSHHNAFSATNVSTFKYEPNSGYYSVGDAFNMTASRYVKQVPQVNSTEFTHTFQELERISCIPSRASYKVNVTYSGGLRTVTRSERYLSSIRDYMIPVTQYMPTTPTCDRLLDACKNAPTSSSGHTEACDLYDACGLYAPAVWPQPILQTFTAFNDFALVDALVSPLSGNYTMFPAGTFATGGSAYFTCGPTGGTIVADTRLNVQRDNYTRSAVDGPSFVVSEDILNDALFNITMSAAFQFGFWNTTVPVHVTNIQQLYSFVSPNTLIIPYTLCLLLSIPFLYLGSNSLRLNGVSAMSGGFLQILMTTTGSKALDKAAAGGCLGGDENVPEDLKDMKIRFGELVGKEFDEGVVRRAGFGTEDEIMPLRRDVTYGIER